MFQRWMIKRDLPEVMELDRQWLGDLAWGEEEFLSLLRKRGVTALVIEDSYGHIVAYAIYLVHSDHLELDRIVVADNMRRQGVATGIVKWLKKKVDGHKNRNSVNAFVAEDNMAMQCTLRSCGIPCVNIVRGRYERVDCFYEFGWQGRVNEPEHVIPKLESNAC